jgi:hypothetical protein
MQTHQGKILGLLALAWTLLLGVSGPVTAQPEGDGTDHGIVGLWKTVFVAEGSPGIPDGTVVDFGFAQWHADGTEILNSGVRPPATGNFCLGVWQPHGPSRYQLNHFGLSWDATGTFLGPARLQEAVTLDDSATHYEGTFTIDQYDAAGALLAHVEGRVTATRVTVETPVEAVL